MAQSDPNIVTTQQFRPRRVYPERPTVRTTFQLAGRLTPTDEHPTEQDVWENAIRSILGWLRPRCPSSIPAEGWEGSGFECGVAGNNVTCVTVPEEGVWTLRLTHPDMPHGDVPAVPGRHWTTDLALRRLEAGITFGVRVFCTSQAYSEAEIALTRPKVVRYFGESFGLAHARPLDGRVWYLNTEDDLDAFRGWLADPNRLLAVYLLTEADQRRVPGQVSRYLLDEVWLAKLAMGIAHVVVLPRDTSFGWADRVGKSWAAYGGAVRTYRPGLAFEEDMPTEHPLAMPESIVFWRYNDLSGERAFSAFLVDQAYRDAATRRVDWGNLMFFADAVTRRAELARQEAREGADWKTLYEDEISALQEKVKQAEAERDEYIDVAEDAERQRDHYIAENDTLRWQIDSLQVRLQEKTGESIDAGLDYPPGYDDLLQWVTEHLANRIVLHPRSVRELKNAEFADINLVCDALLALATEYRNSKLGHADAGQQFTERLNDLGLHCSGSISRSSAGEFGEAYFVRYPFSDSPRQFLDLHVRSNGNSRDPKRCLAIYFFWDSDTRQVVVGWLPSHLPISIS